MSYKKKSGEIISRRDWERLPEDLKVGFEPSGEIPNCYFDGENIERKEQGLPPEPSAPNGDNEDEDVE